MFNKDFIYYTTAREHTLVYFCAFTRDGLNERTQRHSQLLFNIPTQHTHRLRIIFELTRI